MTRADHLHRAADGEHLDAERIGDHRLHVLRRYETENQRQRRRHRRQDPSGDPAVRRHHAHLPLHLEPLANDAREVVEDLRQIAARLALGEHRRREELRVENRHAFGQALQRIVQRHAEVLPVVDQLELGSDRIGNLVGDHLQAGRKGMAGAQRTRDELDGLRETVPRTARGAWRARGGRTDTEAARTPARRRGRGRCSRSATSPGQ